MRKIAVLMIVATAAIESVAMPSQNEISEVKPLVAELMKPSVSAFKAKKMSGSEVGDKALELAESASTEAAVFLCMRGAVSYYLKDKAYDKAADAIESIMTKFPDIPPETLHEITTSATKSISAKSAQRLFDLHRMASKNVANAQKLKALKVQLNKTPTDKEIICRYAELTAAGGDWDGALKAFAKLGGDIGKMAQDELDGNASAASLADLWWNYKVQEAGAKDVIRQRAAIHYQNAIDSGELEGLKLVLAENRIAETKYAPNQEGSVSKRKNQLGKLMKSPRFKKGLVGYWPFSGNVNDASGNKNNGIIHGVAPVEDRYGTINEAYRFNGSSYIEVPDAPSLRDIKGAVTMAAWINPQKKYGDWITVMQKGDRKKLQYSIAVSSQRLVFADGGLNFAVMAKIEMNKWQHIALTYDGSNVSLYLDGSITGSWTHKKELLQNTNSLFVGYDPLGGEEYFIGDMDDVILYNRALTEKEIQDLYKAGLPR